MTLVTSRCSFAVPSCGRRSTQRCSAVQLAGSSGIGWGRLLEMDGPFVVVDVGDSQGAARGWQAAPCRRASSPTRASCGWTPSWPPNIEEALPLLRGRLREATHLRRRDALAVPLEVRYDDYTVDVPENRILLTAARRLLLFPACLRQLMPVSASC